ncbi:MAG: OmpP1/FadL family transporter [Mangrovibacterium sp.]
MNKGFLKMIKGIGTTAVCFLLTCFPGRAQNNTSNPYSMYGIGELRSQNNAATSAMGNAGIGLRTGSFLNALNPASYTAIDSLNFLFEIGIDGKSSSFESKGETADASDANLSYLALGWRINDKLATSFGFNPFSHTGYEINTTAEIEGTVTEYPLDISGSGNLSRAYVSMAYKLTKNLSMGVKPSFIFGSLEQLQYHNLYVIGSYPVYNSTKNYFHNFFVEIGAQYTLHLKPGDLTLGLMYNPGATVATRREDTSYNSAGTVYENEEESTEDFYIPEEYGIGLAFKNNRNLVAVLDAGVQCWSNHHYDLKELSDQSGVRLKDNPYIRAGFEYTPTQNYLAKYIRRINYRAGFQYAESYLDMRGQDQNEISFSVGLGLPVKNQISRIDVTFEAGQNGTTKNGLIQENFLRLRIGFSLRDLWFQHRKYN